MYESIPKEQNMNCCLISCSAAVSEGSSKLRVFARACEVFSLQATGFETFPLLLLTIFVCFLTVGGH